MKTVTGKATLSKSAEKLLADRVSAREVLKMVIEVQSSKKLVTRSAAGFALATQRSALPAKS